MAINKLCIVGMGLMGGAIGYAARKTGAALRVTGVADSAESARRAVEAGAADDTTLDVKAGVRGASLVILAVPPSAILNAAAAVLPHLDSDTVLTDIGSTKAQIARGMEELLQKRKFKTPFVGSHPLAGSEKRGVQNSAAVTLDGAVCVLTPLPHTDPEAMRTVDEFWRGLEMKTIRMSPDEHDAMLAKSSHMPHFLSAALVGAQTDRSLEVCGPGLRDMTRLAGGDPNMWTGIAEQNATEIAKSLTDLAHSLLELANEVKMMENRGTPGAESARERIFRYLADARTRREDRFTQANSNSGFNSGEGAVIGGAD